MQTQAHIDVEIPEEEKDTLEELIQVALMEDEG